MFKWFWTVSSLGAPIVRIVQSLYSLVFFCQLSLLNNSKLPIYIFEPLNFNDSTYIFHVRHYLWDQLLGIAHEQVHLSEFKENYYV